MQSGSSTQKHIAFETQHHKPSQLHQRSPYISRTKQSSPVIRKQTSPKGVASSSSSHPMWSVKGMPENEHKIVLGKIIFNLELDQQLEHCNQGDSIIVAHK